MRFQKGIGYRGERRPRGPGRRSKPGGCYRMSREAYQARLHAARLRKLVGGKPPRTHTETRRLELEIALGTHRGESYRVMAKRLDCSHVHCWKVARAYRAGLIQWLEPDEQGLLALRDSLASESQQTATRRGGIPPAFQRVPWAWTREWRSTDEIWGCTLLTQEQKTMLVAEFERREYARQHSTPAPSQQPVERGPAQPQQTAKLTEEDERCAARVPGRAVLTTSPSMTFSAS